MVATRSLWGFTLIKEVATSVWVGGGDNKVVIGSLGL